MQTAWFVFLVKRNVTGCVYLGTADKRVALSGNPLPAPRRLSLELHPHFDNPTDYVTHMFMQWGQFLAHDITLFPQSRGGKLYNEYFLCHLGLRWWQRLYWRWIQTSKISIEKSKVNVDLILRKWSNSFKWVSLDAETYIFFFSCSRQRAAGLLSCWDEWPTELRSDHFRAERSFLQSIQHNMPQQCSDCHVLNVFSW